MTGDQARRQIDAEFTTARAAAAAGNAGMVRVCARRAAGIAIDRWLQDHPRTAWAADSVGRLRSVEAEGSFPEPIRQAAHRLAARVREDFSSAFPNNPLDDAQTIIGHFLTEGTR